MQVGTAAGTMSGIVNLSKVAKEIPIAMAKCQIVINDFGKLQKTIEMMNSPVDFVYHLERDIMINKVQLYQDVQRIVRDYNDEKWFDLGTALGNALDKLLIGADITYWVIIILLICYFKLLKNIFLRLYSYFVIIEINFIFEITFNSLIKIKLIKTN